MFSNFAYYSLCSNKSMTSWGILWATSSFLSHKHDARTFRDLNFCECVHLMINHDKLPFQFVIYKKLPFVFVNWALATSNSSNCTRTLSFLVFTPVLRSWDNSSSRLSWFLALKSTSFTLFISYIWIMSPKWGLALLASPFVTSQIVRVFDRIHMVMLENIIIYISALDSKWTWTLVPLALK